MYISSSIADFKQTKQNTKQLWCIWCVIISHSGLIMARMAYTVILS